MRFDMDKQILYLFGEATINYLDMNLTANYLEYSFETREVFARGTYDSTGTLVGKPIFTDAQETYEALEIHYNVDTKRGLIREVVTEVVDGYVFGDRVKKDNDSIIYIENASYCPCDDPNALTSFKVGKLKIIQDDKIITGPGYLSIGGIPTPLAFPFGYFPNKKGEAAGIIIPTYGESPTLGFYLLNGGYYFPLGKKLDVQLLGDIYSKGSWGAKTIVRYKERYRYNGSINLSYNQLRFSDPEFPDFSLDKEFFIRWAHNQDAKANPNSNFRANVNAGSVTNFQNNFNANPNDYLSNTFQSNISYTRLWKRSNLSVNLRHSQNSNSQIVSLTLPEMVYNVNRQYPLKNIAKNNRKLQNWLKNTGIANIGISGSISTKNQISVHDSLISLNNLKNLGPYFKNGARMNLSASTSLKVFKYFTLNPNFNLTERFYIQTIEKYYNPTNQLGETDTIQALKMAHEHSLGVSLTTKIYTYYKYKGGATIRHVLTPNISFTYRPDFGTEITGAFGDTMQSLTYSPYDIGIYGKPSSAEQGNVGINLINNIEMKVLARKDTAQVYKKIKLIDNLNIATTYNIFAEEFNWSLVTISGRTTLFNNLNINAGAYFDPYGYSDVGERLNNISYLENNGGLARLTTANLAVGTSFKPRKKQEYQSEEGTEEELDFVNSNPEQYVDFSVPFTLFVNYNLIANRYFINGKDTTAYTQSVTFNGDISLTKKWKIGFQSGYDFVQEDWTYTNISFYRDMNCWEARFTWVPFGFQRSYNFQINMKSALLRDLKLQRRRSWYDY